MSVPRLIKLKKKSEFQEDVFKIVDDDMKEGPTIYSLDQTTKDPTGGIYFHEQLIKEIDYSEDQTTQRQNEIKRVEPQGEEVKILIVPAEHYAQQCYYQNEMLLDKKKYMLRKFNAKHMMLNALAHELNKVEKRTDKMIGEFAQHKTDMIQIKQNKVDHDEDVEREDILQKFERLEKQMAQFQELDDQSQFNNQSNIGHSQITGSYLSQNKSNPNNKQKPPKNPQPPQIGNSSKFSNKQKNQRAPNEINNSLISNQQTIEQSQSINLDDWLNSIPDRPLSKPKPQDSKRKNSVAKSAIPKQDPKRVKPQSAGPQRQKLWK